jgi:hypothetical protein
MVMYVDIGKKAEKSGFWIEIKYWPRKKSEKNHILPERN